MSTSLQELVDSANALLQPDDFQDYCPNGLQVEGADTVNLLVSGVTASQALIEAAIDVGAEAILVHHGYFWRGENPCLTGMKGRRVRLLMQHDISLLAYHLPLDAHPELGNNAQLARRLGIAPTGGLRSGDAASIGNIGVLPEAVSARAFAEHVTSVLGREVLLEAVGERPVRRIAWCTGAAQGYIDQAAALGADLYLTGEASEPTIHAAREQGIHFIAAGHHATERYGAPAVAARLAGNLGLEHRFIDIDNPV